MSFHLSMENLNLNKSCFGCESDTRYTRSIHVCSSCCHQLKDFTVSRATNEKFSIVIDDSRIDWLENNIGRSDKGKDCWTNIYYIKRVDILLFDIFATDSDNPESTNHITDLNEDCLVSIFGHLWLKDLLSVADSSRVFYTAVCQAFQKKYKKSYLCCGSRDTIG